MLQIGKYVPAHNGREALIQRQFYEQGYIVKYEAAYRSHPDRVCYVPELSDEGYTRQDFLAMCNGQEELAEFLFEMVDWQSPETLKSELLATYEIDFCPVCKKYYFMQGEQIPCPICEANPEEIENADTESEC